MPREANAVRYTLLPTRRYGCLSQSKLDFGHFSKRRMREMSQNIGVHRIFSGSRARPGPCENSRRHQKYLQSGRFQAAKIGQSPAKKLFSWEKSYGD
jgi:hypothetical protein